MNAGLDFESQILVKYRAVDLFRNELNQPSWEGDLVAFSGVTDCYQPIERKLLLTRGLVEVATEANQAIGIVTNSRFKRPPDPANIGSMSGGGCSISSVPTVAFTARSAPHIFGVVG